MAQFINPKTNKPVELEGQTVESIQTSKGIEPNLAAIYGPDRDDFKFATKAADALGISRYDTIYAYLRSEVAADPSLKREPTDANIRELRDARGFRWERIGIRVGLSAAKVQTQYEIASTVVPQTNYSGRGRKFEPMSAVPNSDRETFKTWRATGQVPEEIKETTRKVMAPKTATARKGRATSK